jgi:polysaccharide export outer membrane protein
MKRKIALMAMLIASASVFGQAQKTQDPSDVTVGPGDMLQVKVFQTPDLDTQARVDNAGLVPLPLIGSFHVAGLTAAQAGEEISQAYSKAGYIKGLGVTVLVAENASERVSVLGQVKNPGSIPYVPHMRLLDVIATTGGLETKSGGLVSISHRDGSAPKTYRVTGPMAQIENPVIQPGDTVQAETAGIVYVVGAVNRSGGFVLEDGKTVTLLQAIALAEGPVNTAKLKHASLIRTKDGTQTTIPINVSDLLHNKATDQAMEPNDILFIPGDRVKEVIRNVGGTAISMAGAAAIYHI